MHYLVYKMTLVSYISIPVVHSSGNIEYVKVDLNDLDGITSPYSSPSYRNNDTKRVTNLLDLCAQKLKQLELPPQKLGCSS